MLGHSVLIMGELNKRINEMGWDGIGLDVDSTVAFQSCLQGSLAFLMLCCVYVRCVSSFSSKLSGVYNDYLLL